MKKYIPIVFLVLISIQSFSKDKKELTSITSVLKIKSISFATIIYFPEGMAGDSTVGFITDKESLKSLYDVLSVKKEDNNVCKKFPRDIHQWIIYIHSDNGIHRFTTISSYLKSSKGLLLEPKLFKLLNKKTKKNKKQS